MSIHGPSVVVATLVRFAGFCILVLFGAPAAAEPSVAVLDFGVVGAEVGLGAVYAERFATRLDQRGVKVVTQQTISSMLSIERQKQLLGCSDDDSASCMTELVGAVGSSHVVVGQVARVGDAWQVNVRTIVAKSSATFASFSRTVGSEAAVLDAIIEAAEGLVFVFDPALAKPRIAPGLVAGIGVVMAAVGGVLLGRVVEANARLRGPVDPGFTPADAIALANARAPEQATGIGLLVGGALALGGGLLWWALGGTQRVTLALGPSAVSVLVLW